MNANNLPSIYNPAIKDKQTLIAEFVVRKNYFKAILSDIETSKMETPEQHYLIIGQRGSGKTTLLNRIKYAVEDNLKLRKTLFPVIFSEEQYGISSLADMWNEVIVYLEDNYNWEFNALPEAEKNSDEKLFKLFEEKLVKEKKKILLLVDNINLLFEKFTDIEQKKLRNILMNNPSIRLIGASASYFEDIYDYRKPFYNFFKVMQLEGLTTEEIKTLLLKLSEIYLKEEQIKHVIENAPERIEILRRLTGGIPRTVVLLFQIFADDKESDSIKDLHWIVDAVTPYYKSKMDELPAQQQKIVDAVAKFWDPVSTKELVEKTSLGSKIISAQLRQLERNEIIEKVVQPNTKNHLYKIQERFFNIWYLMRFGRRSDKSRVIWLVRFMEAWCDQQDLERRICLHIDYLKKKQLDTNAAILMGETFLALNIDTDLKHELIKITKKLYPKESLKGFKIPHDEEVKQVIKYYEAKNYAKAYELSKNIDKEERVVNFIIASSCWELKKYPEAEGYINKLLKTDNKNPLLYYLMGDTMEKQEKYDKALQHFLKAEKLGIIAASATLGFLYYDHLNDAKSAIKHFKKGVESGNKDAINGLGGLYLKESMLSQAEDVFKKGIKIGYDRSYLGLGIVYEELKKYDEAEKYYKLAIDKNVSAALVGIARFYMALPTRNSKQINEAEKYLKLALKDKILMPEAYHQLGHLYQVKNNSKREIEYFEKSWYLGSWGGLSCLVSSYIDHSSHKEKALKLIETNYNNLSSITEYLDLKYATILLWNNKPDDAIKRVCKFIDTTVFDLENELTYFGVFQFISLLIAKEQYNSALKLFNNPEYNFKEKYKPLYYALITILKDEYPNEVIKISDEIRETVTDILKDIDKMKVDYK